MRLFMGVYGVAVVFIVFILMFRLVNSTSVIDAIYVICGYTYGPLLGIFLFGIFVEPHVINTSQPQKC